MEKELADPTNSAATCTTALPLSSPAPRGMEPGCGVWEQDAQLGYREQLLLPLLHQPAIPASQRAATYPSPGSLFIVPETLPLASSCSSTAGTAGAFPPSTLLLHPGSREA